MFGKMVIKISVILFAVISMNVRKVYLLFWLSLFCFRLQGQRVNYANQNFNSTLTVANVDSLFVSNCTFQNIAQTAVIVSNIRYVSISNCTIKNISNGGIFGGGINEIYIENNIIDSITNFGILLPHTSLRNGKVFIRNNEIANIQNLNPETGSGIKAYNCDSVFILNNFIHHCAWAGLALGRNSSIQEQQKINYLLVDSNEISFTLSDGISAQENIYNAYVTNNKIHDVANDGIGGRPTFGDHGMYWQAPDALIEGNEIYNMFDGILCTNGGCMGLGISLRTSASVLRNKVYNCTGNGIGYFNDHDTGNRPLLIANNIVFDNDYSGIYINPTSTGSVPNTLQVYNNTVVNKPTQALWHHSCPISINSMSGVQKVNGNIMIYDNHSDSTQAFWNNSATTIEEFQYNIRATSDIGFVDFIHRNLDITISATSAIDKIPLVSNFVQNDFYGQPRLFIGDIGAVEFPYVTGNAHNSPNFIRIKPNPASDMVSLFSDNGIELSQAELINAEGKCVCIYSISKNVATQNIHIENLPKGIYQLKITDINKGSNFIRLVKQ